MRFLNVDSSVKILWILTLINFFNYFDRQVIYPLFPFIKADFSLSDFELGLLGTVFMIVHSVSTVPMGILADRIVRKNIITAGVLIWSLATFFSGMVQNYYQLLFSRSIVGIGEASYSPAATSLLADIFHKNIRAKISSVFHLGMFIGGTFGMILAGLIGTHLGWRWSFYLVGLPGILLAVLSWNIKEDKREHTKQFSLSVKQLVSVFRIKPYLTTIIGGMLLTFTSASIISWITVFIVRYYGYTVLEASVTFGIIVLVAGITGIYAGGLLADHYYLKRNLARSFVIGIAFILASPLLLIVVYSLNQMLLLPALFIATLLMSMYYGPSVALIQDMVPDEQKASAYSFYLFFSHLVGSTIAPSIIGKISDLSSLKTALIIPVITNFLGGIMFLVTTKLMYSITEKKTII